MKRTQEYQGREYGMELISQGSFTELTADSSELVKTTVSVYWLNPAAADHAICEPPAAAEKTARKYLNIKADKPNDYCVLSFVGVAPDVLVVEHRVRQAIGYV